MSSAERVEQRIDQLLKEYLDIDVQLSHFAKIVSIDDSNAVFVDEGLLIERHMEILEEVASLYPLTNIAAEIALFLCKKEIDTSEYGDWPMSKVVGHVHKFLANKANV
ncbi:hypothetical protein [Fretibacter rubidus]|uniref:hypothetical protein n=1 Tax=Fretibacter rubidus TaxID=570162 RepID=UPI003529E918